MTILDPVRTWRPDPLTAVTLGLVALQLVVRGWVVGGSYYFQDDFVHLDLARRLGLTADFLVRDHGGELEVGKNAVVWLLSHVVGTSFAPAAASILVLQAVASLLLFALLRTLFGPSPAILVPWAVYLFTPLALASSAWWSAALQTLPLQIALVLTVLATTRAHRERSWRWGAVAVVAQVTGLLFWEKAVLVLPTALAVHLLVTTSPAPWRSRVQGLLRIWPVWVAQAVVLAGYVAAYVAVVDEPLPRVGAEAGRVVDQTLFRMFVPGLFGGPWHAEGAGETVYPVTETFAAVVFLALAAAVVALSWAVTGPRALEGWALLVGYVAADLLLLGLGRAEWLEERTRDPRFLTDALPVLVVAVLAAWRGLFDDRAGRPAAAWFRNRLSLAGAMRVVAVLAASCLLTTVQLAPEVQHTYARNFVLGVADQLDASRDRPVVSTGAPVEVAAGADLADLMSAVGRDDVFDRPATQMYVFDGLAALRPMDLFPGAEVRQGPEPGCGWRVAGEETVLVPVRAGDPDGSRVVRLGYLAGDPADLRVTVAGRPQTLRVPAGVGRAFFVVGAGAGELSVQVEGVGTATTVCITDAAVGLAWVAG
jgi:hypothetical protein